MFLLLWSVLFATSLNADNIIKVPQKKHDSKVIALNKEFESQIDSLEQNGKNIDEYTKYFKKRIDYTNPFSSEARDYQDSMLIERTRKAPQMPSIRRESNSKITKDIKYSGDLRKIRQGIAKVSNDLDFEEDLKVKLAKQNATLTTAHLTTPKPFDVQNYNTKMLDSHKPKVVIIIDDIANTKQLSDIVAIQSAGLKLTPSIFPVAQGNTKMLESVANLDFFMVHLPLEALAYKDELDTISIYDSKDRIYQKIANIKRILPNTLYINNHTGSKFTEQRGNMEMLLSVLDSHNISFVDSRTTPNTTLPSIANAQNRLILSRDIFIDNNLDSASLNAQIKEGVKIARDRGYAILIAHPHKETLSALKRAQNGALKEVDVIYLNELDSLLKKSNITQYAQMLKSP